MLGAAIERPDAETWTSDPSAVQALAARGGVDTISISRYTR